MAEPLRTPKGTYDVLPDLQQYHTYIKKAVRHRARQAGFKRISPPIFERDGIVKGSATNDPLSKAKNTKAILAASATTQMALEVGGKGKFMYQLFEAYKSGASLGEAFVRSDILLNYGQGSRKYESTYDSGQWQNPAAAMKKEDGTVLRLTSVRLDQDVDQMA
jgi:hypothetical protein|tara:strand:- start:65 stop:553 length:489 start_codon:yes stop_codon:yes gene_type:complete